MKNDKKIAVALIAALSIVPKCNSYASVENLSQNIIKEPKEDIDINSLSKDQVPKNAWIHTKDDGKDIFIYFDSEGNEQKRQDYNPNDPIADRLNDSNSGNIKITYNESEKISSLNVNIKDLTSNSLYIVRLNQNEQTERLPKGKYVIESIGAVDKEGYYKETVNDSDKKEFEIKSQDELKAENKSENNTLELKINEVTDMADIVSEELIDPELEVDEKKENSNNQNSELNSKEILDKLDKEFSEEKLKKDISDKEKALKEKDENKEKEKDDVKEGDEEVEDKTKPESRKKRIAKFALYIIPAALVAYIMKIAYKKDSDNE
ncbi:MAG: hypothetical protein E6704_06970 [Anaerococcus prevotii]|nr:hypothetical protein [Anaerococcus prevotii]